MLRCDNKERFLYVENVRITGYRAAHPYLRHLVKQLVVYGGDESTGNLPTVPLLADWAEVTFNCKDSCLENCEIKVDISHLYHYIVFMAVVVLLCSIFVALMVRWGKQLKKKKF